MLSYELDGLKRVDIPVKRWGTSYRVKVDLGQVSKYSKRFKYVSSLTPSNIKLIATTYHIDEVFLKHNLSKDFKKKSMKHIKKRLSDIYEYKHYTQNEFSVELKKLLRTIKKAFKINVQLGYTVINRENEIEEYYNPRAETAIFDQRPIAINSIDDIQPKVIDYLNHTFLPESIMRWQSSNKLLKEVTTYRVYIYYRNHRLGNNIEIPPIIKNSKAIVNFVKTENKCVFYCIAYHLHPDKTGNRYLKIQKDVKKCFQQYCEFKNITYSLKLYKAFKPLDIYEYHELEDCFKLNINVYEMDIETGENDIIRTSRKQYENVLNILSYENHALYIKNTELFLARYECPKCNMLFCVRNKLTTHMRTKCQDETIDSYVNSPQVYEPYMNRIQSLCFKYKIKQDFYIDHFIVYDFEAILKNTHNQHGENTIYENEHIPVSVSICDSLTNEVKCFVNESPLELLRDMFKYINKVQKKIQKYNKDKFRSLFKEIEDKDEKNLEKSCKQIPIIGFNSGRYDINLIKKDLFKVISEIQTQKQLDEITNRTSGISNESFETDQIEEISGLKNVNAIKSNSYMCISTEDFKILDITNYLPPGTSYDKYLQTYLGTCQCEDKIKCLCFKSKESFCYEYITDFSKLDEPLPPQEAFNSKFKNSKITNDEYERVKFLWNHFNMKTLKDLLMFYNNQDVKPFVEAIKIQREFFKRYNLDMFMDGVSLPGLSEKILYQLAYKNIKPKRERTPPTFEFLQDRLKGYKDQDKKAKRDFNLTIEHVNELLEEQYYCCNLCYKALTQQTASVDRLDNTKGHIVNNVHITHIECNVARKDMNIRMFRKKKLYEINEGKLVWCIDKEYGEIYQKMKQNIAGGPSIIFNRYAERNKTYIRNGKKLVKKVIGYDANALYLWCLGNDMPCGRLTYDEIPSIEDIKENKIFGFLECDIETPEHLKEYFSEMTPIFKNTEIEPSEEIIGKHMYEYNKSRINPSKKSKKLIGSYFGKQILIYTPLLKWYLEHGLVITKTYSFIKASRHQPFKEFMEEVSNARREGDVDKSKAMIAEMMKLVGNSAFGRSGMDKSKHKQVLYETDEDKVMTHIEKGTFHDLDELNDSYEVTKLKRRILYNNPIHLSIAIYQLAKLKMLEFYYDCIDKYIEREDFEYQEMDTDSAYIAFSDDKPFENLIKPHMKDEYLKDRDNYFFTHLSPNEIKFNKRTPGLFKEEWRGDAIISLSSKNYICYLPDNGHKEKLSAKGVQKSRNEAVLTPEGFTDVVQNKATLTGTNKGFRIDRQINSIVTYSQEKTALSYYYDKRQVLEDGISTKPLNI